MTACGADNDIATTDDNDCDDSNNAITTPDVRYQDSDSDEY